MIEREEDRLRSAHSIDMAYKQFLSNNIQGGLMGEAWYNQVRLAFLLFQMNSYNEHSCDTFLIRIMCYIVTYYTYYDNTNM